jgi:hypothetical protein
MSVTIDLREGLLAGVFHVPEAEVPRQVLMELACALYARRALPAMPVSWNRSSPNNSAAPPG